MIGLCRLMNFMQVEHDIFLLFFADSLVYLIIILRIIKYITKKDKTKSYLNFVGLNSSNPNTRVSGTRSITTPYMCYLCKFTFQFHKTNM